MASVRILVLLEIYAYQNAKKSSIFAAAEKPTFIQSLFNKSPTVGFFMKQTWDLGCFGPFGQFRVH